MRDRDFHQRDRYKGYLKGEQGNYMGDNYNNYMEHRKKNRIFFGIAVAVAGLVLFLRALGLFNFDLDLSWPVILIIIGIFAGIKSGFRNHAWWILILIGGSHLIPQFTVMGRPSRHLVWPLALMIGGIMIALRPRRDPRCRPHRGKGMQAAIVSENDINIDVVFGGRKEVVVSKEFKGGSVNVVFGGVELNLAQADFAEPSIVLDCRVTCGGLEIVIPSHWDVKNEINPSFGAVDDERTILTAPTNEPKKILILRGTCVAGGIELKSY